MYNDAFECSSCGFQTEKHPEGSARNHCPKCLCSLHVDSEFPGDRASECHGIMDAVDIDHHKNKGYLIVHECRTCKKRQKNKVAPDDDFVSFVRKLRKNTPHG